MATQTQTGLLSVHSMVISARKSVELWWHHSSLLSSSCF
ncbi:hypothetical protein NC651_016782 [Populus alba x Populus x berolinensis]|nr:hypothetical protein NC651_016782 [Populus alba x Populus x berolinensis]